MHGLGHAALITKALADPDRVRRLAAEMMAVRRNMVAYRTGGRRRTVEIQPTGQQPDDLGLTFGEPGGTVDRRHLPTSRLQNRLHRIGAEAAITNSASRATCTIRTASGI